MTWQCVLELDTYRNVIAGSTADLRAAIGRGADLRIYTEFRHNEHIDVDSASDELIREVAEFGITYLIDHQWVAGIMSLRQPIELPTGFGPRSSMSFFLYNQDGTQAIARPHLDGIAAGAEPGPSSPQPPQKMPRYHVLDSWDAGTNAPSHNFVYDFDRFRFCVNDTWSEVLSHTADGEFVSGSLQQLIDAFSSGCAIKLSITNLCSNLCPEQDLRHDHEIFVEGGSAYYYTDQNLFIVGSHPLVRVCPNVPLRYSSRNWDFGWLMVRSDGHVVYRRCDPYTLQFSDSTSNHAIRWFVH